MSESTCLTYQKHYQNFLHLQRLKNGQDHIVQYKRVFLPVNHQPSEHNHRKNESNSFQFEEVEYHRSLHNSDKKLKRHLHLLLIYQFCVLNPVGEFHNLSMCYRLLLVH